ncbi:hypothetical protein E2C01_032547 [Portunus trituberculatus]|uniref:Uncharacterized protein n=1 Tax=Portunus trituberculatus TaxID=210409 RepID=A0A5B7F180_PORTR|nr:hypothetical protein [Portunus trituberculatus]
MMTSGRGGVRGATRDVWRWSSVCRALQLTSHIEESWELLRLCTHTALPANERVCNVRDEMMNAKSQTPLPFRRNNLGQLPQEAAAV